MEKLTKAQKDELATSFAILALYDGGVSFLCVCVRLGGGWVGWFSNKEQLAIASFCIPFEFYF